MNTPSAITAPRLKALLAAAALALGACNDPVLDAGIEELGEEQAGFEPGPLHRPGQPCLRCHGEYYGQGFIMSMAGTVFLEPLPGEPLQMVEGITVRLLDSEGNIATAVSNGCGNFYLTFLQFDPAFPVRAELWGRGAGGELTLLRPMSSRIGRDGSCGSCHVDPASPYSPGVVFVPRALLPPGARVPQPNQCPEPRFAEVP